LCAKLAIDEQRLQQTEFLCCAGFKFADSELGHVLYRYFDFDFDIDRRDGSILRRNFDVLMKRPAYQEHVAISYEELRPTP